MTPRTRKADAVYQAVPGYEYLELNTRSRIYYVRKFKIGRGELFKSTREKKLTKASRVALDLIAEWNGEKKKQTAANLTVEAACKLLIEKLRKDHQTLDDEGRPLRRKRTFDKDRTYLEDKQIRGKDVRCTINRYFGELYVDELTEKFFDEWVGNTGRKLSRKLGDIAKYLSLLASYCKREEYITSLPRFKNPDRHKKKAIVYENHEILKFIEHAEADLRDLLVIFGENPMRPVEGREMRWEFVTLSTDKRGKPVAIVRIPEWFEKRGEPREFELSENASGILARRKKSLRRRPSPYVFPAPKDPQKPLSDVQLSRMWRRMLKRAGVKKEIKFHWMRHTAYSKLLLDHGEDVAKVSEFGGTSIATLQKNYLTGSHQRTASVGKRIRLGQVDDEE